MKKLLTLYDEVIKESLIRNIINLVHIKFPVSSDEDIQPLLKDKKINELEMLVIEILKVDDFTEYLHKVKQ